MRKQNKKLWRLETRLETVKAPGDGGKPLWPSQENYTLFSGEGREPRAMIGSLSGIKGAESRRKTTDNVGCH